MRLLLFILFITSYPAFTEEVRIGIFAKHSITELQVQVADNTRIFYQGKDKTLSQGNWNIKLQNEKLLFSHPTEKIQGDHILLRSNQEFTIKAISNKNQISRSYKGNLELYAKDKRILLVLTLPLEEYVSSSTYSELGELLLDKSISEQAKNALIASQEIVIRTYIANERQRHKNESYDFCDLTHCIHFAGNVNKPSLYPEIILSGKEPVRGYFHSTCGGKLSGPEVFWSKHEISSHYRRGNDGENTNCKDSPHSNWETVFSNSELEEILAVHNLTSIQTKIKEGRVTSLQYTLASQEEKTVSISTFSTKAGKLLGWNKIKSNYFTIIKTGNHYRFQGKGLGHGIGLCQWGAKSLAANGKSHSEILEFYFPKTELKKTGISPKESMTK